MRRLLTVVVLLSGLIADARGGIIDGLSASRHNRFLDPTFAGGAPPTLNPSFYLSQYDFSGVGWKPVGVSGTFNFAMISPEHFIFAHHAIGSLLGQNVAFRAKDGSYVTRTVSGFTQISGSDVTVGKLNMPVPTGANGVSYYSVSTGLPADYLGKSMYMYDQGARVGRNRAWQVFNLSGMGLSPTDCMVSDYDPITNFDGQGYDPPFPPTDEYLATVGDSGSPTFLHDNENLILLGAHAATVQSVMNGPDDGTADSFLPSYIPQLQSVLSADGYTLSLVSVPEPTSIMLCSIAVGAAACFRRRRIKA